MILNEIHGLEFVGKFHVSSGNESVDVLIARSEGKNQCNAVNEIFSNLGNKSNWAKVAFWTLGKFTSRISIKEIVGTLYFVFL